MDCLLKCGRVMVVRGWGLPDGAVERVDSRRCGKKRAWGRGAAASVLLQGSVLNILE